MYLLHLHRRGHDADRVTPLDVSNLRVEAHGRPMDVAALAVLDSGGLLDEVGEVDIERIRHHVERRLRDVRRLHQVLGRPKGPGRRLGWERHDGFDIADHVRTARVPEPGDEATLLRVCSDLTARPLDRNRPLWEMWLLTGLPNGHVVLLLRLHHVVADGLAALEIFSAVLDPWPLRSDPTRTAPPSGGPRAPVGNDEHPAPEPPRVRRLAAAAVSSAMRVQQMVSFARLGRAPALSWNRPVGSRRVQALVRGDLERARAVAHAHGGKVNDVVLAAVTGGAHRLLEARRELRPGLDMHIAVAASIRRPGETGGNRVGIRVVAAPVDDADAVRRLRAIADRTAPQRNRPPIQPNGALLQRWSAHVMDHQRLINLHLSNMPGPPRPLSFAGARVEEMFQLCQMQGNCAIGVAALSYAGQLNLTVAADPDVVPDLEVFVEGVEEALAELGARRVTDP